MNRLCGSSLDAAIIASRQINAGDADLMLVGGAESMSRAPWVLPKTSKPYPAGDMTLASTTLGWRLVNPAMNKDWTISLGEATERLREKYGITRERQDAFAADSHNLADAAWNEGFYDSLVSQVPGTDLVRDEASGGFTAEKLAGLKTVFRPESSGGPDGGTVTAGNASPLSDGASAAWIGSEAAAGILGLEPLARIAGRARTATTPSSSASHPWRPRTRPSRRRASAGTKLAPSNLTRRSPRNRWRALTRGGSTLNREPARRGDRHGPPARCFRYAHPGNARPFLAGFRAALGRRSDLHRRGPRPGRGARKRYCRRIGIGGLRVMLNFIDTVGEAVAGIKDGSTVMIGGFGNAGQPFELIDALMDCGAKDLTVVNNNAGQGDQGLALLIKEGRVRKMICSFPRQSDSWHFDAKFHAGEIELELVPQGNLAERIRLPAPELGVSSRPPDTAPRWPKARKPALSMDGARCLRPPPFTPTSPDQALKADGKGNLIYRKTARNFGPPIMPPQPSTPSCRSRKSCPPVPWIRRTW